MINRRRRQSCVPCEALEDRTLLSVTATFNPGSGRLTIKGESNGTAVRVEGTSNFGDIDVYYGAIHLGNFTSVKHIRAKFGSGDDVLFFSAVRLAADLKINMGSGADRFVINNTPVAGASPDGNISLTRKITVQMGSDPGDFISVNSNSGTHGIYLMGDTKFLGVADVSLFGTGGSVSSEEEDVHINGNLLIKLSPYGDVNGDGANLLFQDVDTGAGWAHIFGAQGPDVMRVYYSSFFHELAVNLRSGDDLFDTEIGVAANDFHGPLKVLGGSGIDTYDESPLNVFDSTETYTSIEFLT